MMAAVIRPMLEAALMVNHSAPSCSAVMPSGWLRRVGVGGDLAGGGEESGCVRAGCLRCLGQQQSIS